MMVAYVSSHVAKLQHVIERIGTVMTQTLHDQRSKIDGALLPQIEVEWDRGRMSVEPTRIFMAPPKLDGLGRMAFLFPELFI